MTWRSYIFPQTIARLHSRYNKDIRLIESQGALELFVDGSRESGSYMRKFWRRAFRDLRAKEVVPPYSILVLGVAGGTVIHLLRDAYPLASIVGVDIDRTMLDVGRQYFGLSSLSGLRMVEADAKVFLHSEAGKRRHYDMVIVDLFIGRIIPSFVTESSFIDGLARVVFPHGTVIINYLREGPYQQKSENLCKKLETLFSRVHSTAFSNNRFFLASEAKVE
ncbi:methyltransferase domain-containing protein [Patescibacteria group bacterium]|nr:methyltransferase domain-containing protein [Patescibacteria group bacterium]MBU1472702.1 methyltransferase domain-containing protein [Patescibacteria group bacterium]MBU2459969.1 methyltransferase domain-containing protein [Patescibacteria group bacterium]MBU2544373.1 methyltransferase domain-containing protein [Patescibacteria group bacterium]